MTEQEALQAAKESVEAALKALENYKGGSYAADEAHNLLTGARLALERGLKSAVTDIGGPACPGVWDGTDAG